MLKVSNLFVQTHQVHHRTTTLTAPFVQYTELEGQGSRQLLSACRRRGVLTLALAVHVNQTTHHVSGVSRVRQVAR